MSDGEPQPIGPLLDALGVSMDIQPGEHLVDVVVIGKLAPFGTDDDRPRLYIAASDGLDWIGQAGLFHAARTIIDRPADRDDGDAW